MANVTLRQLRYFDALARHRHFGRAAETAAVTQPALSVQIKDLESALGVQLVERTARQVRLTPVGDDLWPRVRAILRGVDDLSDLARASRATLTGQLRLGVIPTVAPYLLPDIIARLGQSHPGLDIHVRETLTSRLLLDVTGGALDTAIVALPVDEPGLTEVALFTEAFVLVRPRADADAPVPGPERLREMRLLLLEEGHCFRDQALSFCGAPRPREVLDGSSLTTLVQMVGAGIGVTLIPEMAVEVETRGTPVALSRFADVEPSRTVGMIWRDSNPLAPQLQSIAEVVRAAGQGRAARAG